MAMASVAASAFGEQLFAQLLPALAKTGGQAIISPLSVWFALLLLLNGAGKCLDLLAAPHRVTAHTQRPRRRPMCVDP